MRETSKTIPSHFVSLAEHNLRGGGGVATYQKTKAATKLGTADGAEDAHREQKRRRLRRRHKQAARRARGAREELGL